MSQVGEPVEASYFPGDEEVSVRRWGLKGRFNEDDVDSVTCIVDRRPRIGETDPVSLPEGAVEIPVTGDMVLVDARRPVFEDPSMPAALASEVAPDEGEDPEFAARVKELVESAGLRVSVAAAEEHPKFKARFLKRVMGSGVYTDELSLTPFDDEDAERILAVHADSREDNSTLRTTMTHSGITFEKSWRHGARERDMYFQGVSVAMPFSRRDAGEFAVAVGDDMDEARISYNVTGRDTGNVRITRPDGVSYDVEIVSAKAREVRVMLNEVGGAYTELGGDELAGFVADTVGIRRGMHAEMSRVEGLTRVFGSLFEDVSPQHRPPPPTVISDADVGEPLNPAKHWDENTYGVHSDANVHSLLPEKMRIPPAYPADIAVDNQPLGWRAVYTPEEWYQTDAEDDPYDLLGGRCFPEGFEVYQRMGLYAASRQYTEDVMYGRRRGIILQPLSAESHGLGVNVNFDGERLRHGGMFSMRDQTHYVQTNFMRGSCTCYLSDGAGKVQEFVFYAATTPIDDLAIRQVYVSPEYQAQSGVRLVQVAEDHEGPIYEVAKADQGEVMPQQGGDEKSNKNIRVRGSTIPGLDEETSTRLVRDFILDLYQPFGPGNVLVGRGGMVSSLQHWNREGVIDSADTATAYAVPPEMEEQFRRAVQLGVLERD